MRDDEIYFVKPGQIVLYPAEGQPAIKFETVETAMDADCVRIKVCVTVAPFELRGWRMSKIVHVGSDD